MHLYIFIVVQCMHVKLKVLTVFRFGPHVYMFIKSSQFCNVACTAGLLELPMASAHDKVIACYCNTNVKNMHVEPINMVSLGSVSMFLYVSNGFCCLIV